MTFDPDGVDAVDAVVVGSGPGGSTAADVLTAAGWSVLMFERGRNHLVATEPPYDRLEHFSNDEVKFISRHFLGPDPLVEPRTFRRTGSAEEREHVGEVNDLPATVGGGGVHADGKLPRFRPEDFQPVSADGPMPDSALADWPIGYDEMESFYCAAEAIVGVAGDNTGNPFAPWRSKPFPMPPGAPMKGALLASEAARHLGFHPYAAPTGVNSVDYDGRPACRNCGHCAFYGCPIHAKGDPVAPLQKALRTGRLRLWAECFASRVTTAGGRATGVDYVDPTGRSRHVAARHVVLAGGAMESPRLALLSGIEHPALGAHLMFHFQTLVTGCMPVGTDMLGMRGRSVTHGQDDSVVCDAPARAAARAAGLPWIRGGFVEYASGGGPVMTAKEFPPGAQHRDLMRQQLLGSRLWALCQQGEDMPLTSNRVDLDPGVRDARGIPVARVTHAVHPHELVASEHWRVRLTELLVRMGTEWQVAVTSPMPHAPYGHFISPVSQSKHVMGTMRMGDDPSTSVTDRWGRLHALPNVLVADASPFVTSAGYGPTLTLVALALRNAHALAGTSLPLPLVATAR